MSEYSFFKKESPLLTFCRLYGIISNIPKWMNLIDSKAIDIDELEEIGIEVEGCGITFPDEESKVWFLLKYGP